MSNRLNAEFKFPVLPDFAISGGSGGVVSETRARTAQTIALGQAFADLFRSTWNFFARIDRSIANARAMRDLVNLNDRVLADIGITRSEIPAIIAREGFDDGLETAVAKYLHTVSDKGIQEKHLAV